MSTKYVDPRFAFLIGAELVRAFGGADSLTGAQI
jgi:hypothetical protein